MTDLQNYLNTNLLSYDVIIIHLTAPYCIKSKYMPILIASNDKSYVTTNVLSYIKIIDPTTKYIEYIPATKSYYTTSYIYIEVTSPEIVAFYKENLFKDIPYFITFKKKHPNITRWWYPCKSISCLATMDDITLFVKASLQL